MVFNRFKFGILLRLLVIFIISFAGFFTTLKTYFWMVGVWLFVVVIFLIIELLRYIDQSHRKLKDFLYAIQQEDFNISPQKMDKYHKEISDALLNIRSMIKKFRVDAEVNFQYLQMVVDQVDVAIFCYDDDGKVKLINRTFRNLFDLKTIANISILKKNDPAFHKLIYELSSGEKTLIKYFKRNQLNNLSVHKVRFRLDEQNYSLISIKDVQQELDYKEVESWQKLTSVLTHEIMNSAIPISNLSGILRELLFDKSGKFKTYNNIEHYEVDDIQESLDVIQSRSKGLVNFVKATKSITKIPEPVFNEVAIDSLINHVLTLLKSKLEENKIVTFVDIQIKGYLLNVDEELIQQVLINIIGNAIDAVNEVGNLEIQVKAYLNCGKHVEISIQDNGFGMTQDMIGKIFIPFFTTKKKGSGIGLSLSRQIIYMHRGSLNVRSVAGESTTFIIAF